MAIREVAPKEFHEVWKRAGDQCLLLDVRTAVEFRERRAAMAKSLPLNEVSAERVKAAAGDHQVYLICKSGARARQAAEKLAAEGYRDVVLVSGGTDAWADAGLPVTREAGVISLERQVRIGAGLFVAMFSALSLLVHPYFVLGALFVGCGLIFAGITNWCGMALVLARMPWNKGSGANCSV